jgi:hypothetical protein
MADVMQRKVEVRAKVVATWKTMDEVNGDFRKSRLGAGVPVRVTTRGAGGGSKLLILDRPGFVGW